MKIILTIFILAISMSLQASEITFTSINPFSGKYDNGDSLLIKGKIVAGDYEKMLAVINKNTARYLNAIAIILSSPGGNVHEAIKISRFVKNTYKEVHVGRGTGMCSSACFIIYSAAVRRLATPKFIGIHRPSINSNQLQSMSPREAEKFQNIALQEMRDILYEYQVPNNLIDKMFQYASTESYFLTNDDLTQKLGRSPPWYEQLLIARCGLDKAKEERFFNYNIKSHGELSHITAVGECAKKLTAYDRCTYLLKELKHKDEVISLTCGLLK